MTASLAGAYAGLVCDLDGVVYRGPSAVPHAVASLTGSARPLHFATNNASRTPGEVAAHLSALGLATRDTQVTTSSQAGAWVLQQRLQEGATVLAVGGLGVGEALREAGFVVTDSALGGVPAVLQGYGPQVTASALAEVAYAVQSGAVWVATNTDRSLPTDRGVAPGNGSLISAVRFAVARDPDEVAGKPHTPLYQLCAQRMHAPTTDVLAIGDRLDTDIQGAVALGMDSLLVLTGVTGLAEVLTAAPSRRPTYVVPDLSWLAKPADDPAAASVMERLRSVWARVDSDGPNSVDHQDEVAALTQILGDGGSVA